MPLIYTLFLKCHFRNKYDFHVHVLHKLRLETLLSFTNLFDSYCGSWGVTCYFKRNRSTSNHVGIGNTYQAMFFLISLRIAKTMPHISGQHEVGYVI